MQRGAQGADRVRAGRASCQRAPSGRGDRKAACWKRALSQGASCEQALDTGFWRLSTPRPSGNDAGRVTGHPSNVQGRVAGTWADATCVLLAQGDAADPPPVSQ